MSLNIADICQKRRYDGPTPCEWPVCACFEQPRISAWRIVLCTLGVATILAFIFVVLTS